MDKSDPETAWSALVTEFATGRPHEARGGGGGGLGTDLEGVADDVAEHLIREGLVLDTRKGRLFISCPWESGHSMDSGPSQTAWLVAGSRGYPMGRFDCRHAGCRDRTNAEFLEVTGIGAAVTLAAFDVVEPDPNPTIVAKWGQRFIWRDPATIPPRRWLYRPHLIRGFVSLTVSPGGVGKSTLTLCEALALASGRPLLGTPVERSRVWIWNGEDPAEEIERRIHAAMIHHGLSKDDIEGWLFFGSGRDADLVIAEQGRNGITVAEPVVGGVIQFIRDKKIDVVVIDPFVSSHRVIENDNGAIDRVVKAWGRIASATDGAVDVVHHTRKTGGADVTVEDGRGAVALLAAARHARTLRPMSDEEADRLGVERLDRWSYIRVDSGKANLTPPAAKANWFQLVGVQLPNGDNVQAAAHWIPPDPFDDITPADLLRVQQAIEKGCGEKGDGWRANIQTGAAWVGNAIAQALDLDATRLRDRGRIKELLKTWLANGSLVMTLRSINAKGKTAPFVEVGRWGQSCPPHLAKVGGGPVGEAIL